MYTYTLMLPRFSKHFSLGFRSRAHKMSPTASAHTLTQTRPHTHHYAGNLVQCKDTLNSTCGQCVSEKPGNFLGLPILDVDEDCFKDCYSVNNATIREACPLPAPIKSALDCHQVYTYIPRVPPTPSAPPLSSSLVPRTPSIIPLFRGARPCSFLAARSPPFALPIALLFIRVCSTFALMLTIFSRACAIPNAHPKHDTHTNTSLHTQTDSC